MRVKKPRLGRKIDMAPRLRGAFSFVPHDREAADAIQIDRIEFIASPSFDIRIGLSSTGRVLNASGVKPIKMTTLVTAVTMNHRPMMSMGICLCRADVALSPDPDDASGHD